MGHQKNYNADAVINACAKGDLEYVQTYFQGKDVNYILSSGWNILTHACLAAQIEIIKYLLENDADPTKSKEGFTALMALCKSKDQTPDIRLECLKHLLKKRTDDQLNATSNILETPLMFACQFQEVDFVKEILQYVTNVDFTDNEERTALFYATIANKIENVKVLIENGATINVRSYHGEKPIDIAVTKGYKELIPLLKLESEEEQEIVESYLISSWKDMFHNLQKKNLEFINQDVENMLQGMGLGYYKKFFKGVDIKTFLRLREEELEKFGIDISPHKKRFINDLLRFHVRKWSPRILGNINPSSFTGFDSINILANCDKQLLVLSSSIDFGTYCFSKMDRNNFTMNDESSFIKISLGLNDEIKKMKEVLNKTLMLAQSMKNEQDTLRLPTYIGKKERSFNKFKWIIGTVSLLGAIYFLKYRYKR